MVQSNRAHPLFSRLGCGSALLLVLILGSYLYLRGGGPFSPGHLSGAEKPGTSLGGFASHLAFEQQCNRCHQPWLGIEATRCERCHEDVTDQRLARTGLHGKFADVGYCQSCHTEHEGVEVEITHFDFALFDHARLTPFSLAKHALDYDGSQLVCAACHLEGNYTAAAVDCAGCHQQADGAFMAEHDRLFGPDCLACHDGVDAMSDFDHDSQFVLAGQHTALDCLACHVDQHYGDIATECSGCHEEPALHAGQFGLDCARCHQEDAWQPARLQQHTFPLDHGDEGEQECLVCHEAAYTEVTCYGCHAHREEEMRSYHLAIDIPEFADCIACHPTGIRDEVEVRNE